MMIVKKWGLGLLLLLSLILINCKKKTSKAVDEPTPPAVKTYLPADTENRTTINVTFVNRVVADFLLMAGQLGEDSPNPFFSEVPGTTTSSSGTVTTIRDNISKLLSVSFNQTKCMDGLYRNGTVAFNYSADPSAYPNAAQGANFFREFGFACKITLAEYRVGDYLVTIADASKPPILYNTLQTSQYNPETTKLSWILKGKFIFTHLTDPSKNMTWDGELTNTLDNTNDPGVFITDKNNTINWPKTKLSYKGSASGKASASDSYTFTIDATHPLKRDFVCSLPIIYPLAQTVKSEFHPMLDGLVFINVSGSTKLRNVFYSNVDFSLAACNSSGLISIDGLIFPIDFR